MAEIGQSRQDAKRNNIGGLLNGGGSWPTEEPGSRPVDWLAMADLYYKETVKSKSRIPIIWGTDVVHGFNNSWSNNLSAQYWSRGGERSYITA